MSIYPHHKHSIHTMKPKKNVVNKHNILLFFRYHISCLQCVLMSLNVIWMLLVCARKNNTRLWFECCWDWVRSRCFKTHVFFCWIALLHLTTSSGASLVVCRDMALKYHHITFNLRVTVRSIVWQVKMKSVSKYALNCGS